MMTDLEQLAKDIAINIGETQLVPVIEKEIVHYEILRSLSKHGLLQDITFQGGTSLRLCYGSQRYSEDLDFAAGGNFDSLPLNEFSEVLRSDLLKSYDVAVSVKEPKIVNDANGVGMRRWTVSVNTSVGRPDLPAQRIKIEIASVPAHTSVLREVTVNYPELGPAYSDLLVRCQSPEEILADKLFSFSATDSYIRHRDLWDIPWLARRRGIDFARVPELVSAKYSDYGCTKPLPTMIAIGMQRARTCYSDGSFERQMRRFLPKDALNRTIESSQYLDFIGKIVEEAYEEVASSLGISEATEEARRELSASIDSDAISDTVAYPKRL